VPQKQRALRTYMQEEPCTAQVYNLSSLHSLHPLNSHTTYVHLFINISV